jgi:two-component system NtrC family sensor kinase
VRPSAPGDAALRLSWLPPRPNALLALATQTAAEAWRCVRTDPGAVFLIARHLPSQPGLSPQILESAAPLATARRLLACATPPQPDWSNPELEPIYQAAIRHALLAERWARKLGQCDPEAAWLGAWTAALGWLAVAVADPGAAAECWRHPVYTSVFAELQRRLWGLDAGSLARRLARRWGFPPWLSVLAGSLHCPAELACRLGADEGVFRIVQWAGLLAAEQGADLGYGISFSREELAAGLSISPDDQLTERDDELFIDEPKHAGAPNRDEALCCILDLALALRERPGTAGNDLLETEVDRLHDELARQSRTEKDRLEARKLRALAEFAAGAGHEINNPLAVISVHAQQLLQEEEDESRRSSLQRILRQTERIHQILRDLMQFARPPRPRRQECDLCHLVHEVGDQLRPWAEEMRVRLNIGECVEAAPILADVGMIRTALTCLVRNAIEAASPEGWARVWVERGDGNWRVVVEDSGTGPPPRRQDLLFNPFFSGRSAGRGRGLGLPTAWRLVQENGGNVCFEPSRETPSRFVLSLPAHPSVTTPLPVEGDALRRTA